MVDLGRFNPDEHHGGGDFDPIPAAWYPLLCVTTERRQAKSGPDNYYLQIEWQVADGEYKGRKVWDRLNLWNTNKDTVDIAWKRVGDICRAFGIGDGKLDSSNFHGKVLAGKLTVKEDPGYSPKNEVAAYDAAAARFRGPGGPAPRTSSQPSGPRPPWER